MIPQPFLSIRNIIQQERTVFLYILQCLKIINVDKKISTFHLKNKCINHTERGK